ncbi:N-acetylmuramoyl-L-alanine amidase [Hyalangium rubrum]|uniref:N-acetylmuramoyl-L-alanine amidase n=1 Tax=Hyalangium rubrum TaxID=3103134 RepID=A0ABU5HC80_9BACT|nr:N-acetylmuramoyl-L-alanine amidase [Hyalangium sp. s54d21]MDY7231068.1 N-acetylmuramoyl-L-alanine amidase [Hyalangium sp. s54d21]
MRTRLVLCLLLLSTVAAAAKRDVAEEAYQEARTSYYALKGDAARRKLRHHWLKVSHRFEAVASEHPKSERAPDALFTAGELMSELSRISFLAEDLQAAVGSYGKLVAEYPRHRLADDAALSLARIHLDRLEQPETARRVITETLALNGKGDRARELKELLASLPAPKASPARTKAPAVAEAPAPQPERSGNALVEAISRTARESAPATPSPAAEPAPRKVEEGPRVVVITPLKPEETPAPVAKSAGEAVATTPSVSAETPAVVASVAKPRSEPTPVAVKPAPEKVSPPAKQEAPTIAVAAAPSKAEKAEKAESDEDEAGPLPMPSIPALDQHVAEARMKTAAKLSRRAELTLVEQLGLKVRRVIIDPGHGGHDTGAIGKQGTREKDITLAISHKLAQQLRERGLEVILTRDDDRYVKLEGRAQFANEARGDLFISIHCNSAHNRKLRGVETYTLNISSDRYSIRLAARENASTEKGISDLQFILADLATKANTGESTRLASQVQKSLVGQLTREYTGIKDLGHKEALFYVLLGVKMPAILVETAFLSHAEEEERLASEAYQDSVARAIAQGVEDFLGDRNRLAKVD